MKRIKLSKGLFATVDETDFARVNQHKWCVSKCKNGHYAVRGIYLGRNKEGKKHYRLIKMHRFILGIEDNTEIRMDHEDHDTLNNRRNNLRIATQQENSWNRKHTHKTNRYKGASLKKGYNKWLAQLSYCGVKIFLGVYRTDTEAAIAYNHGAKKYYGKFAWFNDIPGWEDIIPERVLKKKTTKYRGVSIHTQTGEIIAKISHKCKAYHIGAFETAEEAAKAYNKKAIELKGNKAKLNEI